MTTTLTILTILAAVYTCGLLYALFARHSAHQWRLPLADGQVWESLDRKARWALSGVGPEMLTVELTLNGKTQRKIWTSREDLRFMLRKHKARLVS